MQTSFEIQLVWNQVRLLDLLELVDQGGLGLGGDWGPLKFAPQKPDPWAHQTNRAECDILVSRVLGFKTFPIVWIVLVSVLKKI